MNNIQEHYLKSVIQFYSSVSGTITDTIKDPTVTKSSTASRVFDYINNYLIFAAPLLYLKETTDSKDNYVHDCYVISREIITKSEIPLQDRNLLLTPLNSAEIYAFAPRSYKTDHLKGYLTYLTNTLTLTDDDKDNEATMVYKELIKPFLVFLLAFFPVNNSSENNIEANLDTLYRYLSMQISILHDSMIIGRMYQQEKHPEEQWKEIANLIKKTILFMKKEKYNTKNIDYTTSKLKEIYGVIQENKLFKSQKIVASIEQLEQNELDNESIKKDKKLPKKKSKGDMNGKQIKRTGTGKTSTKRAKVPRKPTAKTRR